MQYLLLIYQAEEIWENMSEAERREVLAGHIKVNTELAEREIEFSGQPLMPTSTAVSVRKVAGERMTTDGPFAETKEQLAGFYLVDVDSIDTALAIAEQLPEVVGGTVEVRPVADHSQYV